MLTALSVLVVALTRAPALPPMVVSSTLAGRFARSDCGQGDAAPPVLFTLARELSADPGAVRLDDGNVLAASAVGALAVDHDPQGLAQTLKALGLQGLALGRRDLTMPRATLVRAGAALDAVGLPFLLSNLSCAPSAKDLCDVVRDAADAPWLVEGPTGQVGVVAVLSPAALKSVAPERASGLSLGDPFGTIVAATRKARAAGAVAVVVLYDGANGNELEDTLTLATRLGESGVGPDVVVASHLASVMTVAMTASARGVAIPVVASQPGHAVRVVQVPEVQVPDVTSQSPAPAAPVPEVHSSPLPAWPAPVAEAPVPGVPPWSPWISDMRQLLRMPATMPRPAPEAPATASANSALLRGVPAKVSSWSQALGVWMCTAYAGEASRWPLTHPMSEQEFSDLLLDVLRAQTHAEVAVLNRGALIDVFPLRNALTRLDVMAALPFDNSLRMARVPGAQIKKALIDDANVHNLRVRGASLAVDGKVTINGRPLDETQSYQLLTNDYLAEGGDGGLVDKTVRFSPVGVETVRDLWLSWLGPPSLNGGIVERWPVDPSRLIRWVFLSTVDINLNSIRVVNPMRGILTDPQLSRNDSIAFRGDVEQRADADHPELAFENGLRLRYGVAATTGADGTRSGLTETDDLIVLRDTLSLKRWGNSAPHWYVPVAFAESYLESEFNRPDTRSYHHLEWRPIAGIRLPLTPDFAVFGGAGLDWETLARSGHIADGEPAAAAVLVGGLTLKPRRLFATDTISVDGEGSLDVAWRDPAGASAALVRFRAKASVPIFRRLALTLSYDLFARHIYPELRAASTASSRGWGFSGDALIGLSFMWVEPLQLFAL